jgi:hypothetical protein
MGGGGKASATGEEEEEDDWTPNCSSPVSNWASYEPFCGMLDAAASVSCQHAASTPRVFCIQSLFRFNCTHALGTPPRVQSSD